MDDELRPIDELLVQLFQGCGVVLVQFDLLPEPVGSVGSLCSLHVEVAYTFLFTDCGVLGVRERTGPTIAQPGEVEFIAAEVLGFSLDAEGAVLVVDHGPDYLVDDHFNN